MSDLINRSELIENFRKCYSGHLGMENSDSCMTFHGICNVINNTNTAYDVSKVVEELEAKENEAILKAPNTSDITNPEYQKWMMKSYGFKDAIEIVKRGGVSNDVCEWKMTDTKKMMPYETSCGNEDLYDNSYKYCPYCGKKILCKE